MTTYKCVIVDDEPLAQDLLEGYIAKIPYLELVQKCSSAIEAQLYLSQHETDLLFLDISMPNLTGIDLLKMLNTSKIATVFTTAYSEHAIEAFELDAVDYLLKPIEFDRFFKSVSKAIQRLQPQNAQTSPPIESLSTTSNPTLEGNQTDYFFVKSDYRILKVAYADVLFIESAQKYICIHTTTQKIITLLSMSRVLKQLPTHQFFRIHRSYIVNIAKVDSIEGNLVCLGKHELPISKGQREGFFKVVEGLSING